MAKTKQGSSKKGQKSVALRVFNILFLVALVIGIVAAILLFTPAASSVKGLVKGWGWSAGFATHLNNWVKYHVVANFKLPITWGAHGPTYTSCVYLFLMACGALLGLFLMYIPFLVMHKLRVKGKTQVWRKIVLWVAVVLVFLFFAVILMNFWKQRLARDMAWAQPMGHAVLDLARWWRRLFVDGGSLHGLVITSISGNATAWALVYAIVALILFEDILFIVSALGKVKQAAVIPAKDELDEAEEEPVQELTPAPVAAAGVVPTVRELAVVNSLNPLYETKIETLPGLYEEKAENAEPVADAALAEAAENKEAVEGAKPFQKKVPVLPGIDEWNANPWEDEEPVEEVAAPVEEVKVEEPVEEEAPVENTAAEEKDLTEAAAPEQEEVKVEEPAPVEEKPAEPAKPAPRVAQVDMVAFDPSKRERKNVAPVGVVEPMKKEEEPVPVVEEEKPVLAPISGPLHSTEKSKHEKIEAVEARKVKFELKNYQVKTYEGDLTAEEAFAKGVTKVQPVVNPVFANQAKEPAWKQKRRQEEIRANGYGEVEQLETLNGKTAVAPAAVAPKKATSIRDLVKANKAANEEPKTEEVKEENKIAKPVAPVAFKPVEKPEEKAEEVKEDKPAAPAFHPIAPIQKKDRKRPEIKPIDPMKSKNSK